MRVAIVEDEVASREILKTLLEDFCEDITIVATARTVAEAVPLLQQTQPELIFLDIELPRENGFALLKHFDPIPFKIIFTTAYEEYAIQALRISATDYLLKPLELEELQNAIDKARESIGNAPPQNYALLRDNYFSREPKLSIATTEGYLFIKIKDIMSCKADGRYTCFYLQDGTQYLTAKNLGEYEIMLQGFSFMRVHRSQIINLNKIKKFVRGKPAEVILEDDSRVLVSNTHREALLDFLGIT